MMHPSKLEEVKPKNFPHRHEVAEHSKLKMEKGGHTFSLPLLAIEDAPFLSLEASLGTHSLSSSSPKWPKLKPLRLVHFFSMSHLQVGTLKAPFGLTFPTWYFLIG